MDIETYQNTYYQVAHRSQEEINSFKTRYDIFDESVIPQIFQKNLGLKVVSWNKSQSWGSSHVIFFVLLENNQKLVFRANTGFNKTPEVMMKVEQLITDKVKDLGVPTNKILYVDISRKEYPFDYQIEECLEGEDLEDHFNGSQEEYDNLSFEIGKLVAKFHEIKLPKFGKFDFKSAIDSNLIGSKNSFYEYITLCLESDLKYLLEADVINQEKLNYIKELFEEYKDIINIDKGVLLHHDLADHNIMFKDNRITGIFDWENAVIGDPVLDIASCPTWKTHYPREEKFIEGYTSVTPLPAHFQEKMNIYRLRTMLWKMVYAIRANILDDARKQKFYNALKPFNI